MRVVIGTLNPDGRLAGQGMERLEASGVEVVVADHAASIALHADHRVHTQAARPYVTATMTISADGMVRDVGTGGALSKSDDALRLVDAMRSRANASLVSSKTVRRDDPQLVVEASGLQSRTPLRVIVTDADGIDRKATLVGSFSGYRTAIIAETETAVDAPASVEILRVPSSHGQPDLSGTLAALGAKGIQSVLVEPDSCLGAAMLDADLIDCFALVVSPTVVGDNGLSAHPDGPIEEMLVAAGLVVASVEPLGDDSLIHYRRPA
jgi:diaminohydroxyphosphoribosylaminopyrimidine deaminase/5-amino-6-(5-phosphoribosylamino)uracil reductase